MRKYLCGAMWLGLGTSLALTGRALLAMGGAILCGLAFVILREAYLNEADARRTMPRLREVDYRAASLVVVQSLPEGPTPLGASSSPQTPATAGLNIESTKQRATVGARRHARAEARDPVGTHA